LDAGQHRIVENYELQWWSSRKPRDLDAVQILKPSTVKKCLEHYKEQKSKAIEIPGAAGAGSLPDAGTDELSGISGADADADIPMSNVHTGAGAGCSKCNKYRELLIDVLRDAVKCQSYASLMSTSSENAFNIGVRRASTFSILYDASILKETADVPVPAQAKAKGKGKDNTARRISIVRENALSDLERMKNLPASSYKWTWGMKLTEEEVLNLRRIGTNPGQEPHSAYDISLKEGKLHGEHSDGPSMCNSLTGNYDALPADAEMLIPSTDLYFPDYFSNPEYRLVYNPLRRPAPALSVTSNVLSVHNLEDSGNIADEIEQIAHLWDIQGDAEPVDVAPVDVAPVDVASVDEAPVDTDADILDVADAWQAPALESDADSNEPEYEPTAPLSDLMPVDDADADRIFDIAEAWVPGLMPVAEADADDEVLNMADGWNDQGLESDYVEHSDDELTNPSYHNEEAATTTVFDWSQRPFGPEHFEFLRDDMFLSDEDGEAVEDDEEDI
jgi:hypothetical protein